MADVPLCVFLSGGIDSSAIVALVQRYAPSQLKTFSIGFPEPDFDESGHAAAVARHFGAQHFSRSFDHFELIERVSRVAQMLDDPFADPSIFPTAMLSELAAEHMKVVLGGDGADELFAGYSPFRALHAARWYHRLVPRNWDRTLLPIAKFIPQSDANLSLALKASRFLRGAAVSPDHRMARWMGPFTPESLQRLLPNLPAPMIINQATMPGDNADSAAHSDMTWALSFYQRVYLPDDILVKMNRASMMHSLEFRAPFLDTELVEFANRLPAGFKLRGGCTKWILKRALLQQGLLPNSIVHRRKQGFGIPVARWMRVELQDYFRGQLIEDWPHSLSMFDQTEIHRLWTEHCDRQSNHYKELWALFMLAQWARATENSEAQQSIGAVSGLHHVGHPA